MLPWRDVCPRAMLADKCPDPVSIISAITQEHCSRLEARQELGGKSVVVSFPSCERESYRQAVFIDHRMNLAAQPASRPAHGLFLVASRSSIRGTARGLLGNIGLMAAHSKSVSS